MMNATYKLKTPDEIESLWDSFKQQFSKDDLKNISNEIAEILKGWNHYRDLLEKRTLPLEQYTSILRAQQEIPGGYLCNFLERTTSKVFGSSKPGNSFNYGVKCNDDETYYLSKENPKADKETAEKKFDEILTILKNIVNAPNVEEMIKKIENEAKQYSAKQILRKMAVINGNANEFLHIYSDSIIDKLFEDLISPEAADDLTNLAKNRILRRALNDVLELNDSLELNDVLGLDSSKQVQSHILSRFLWEYATTKTIVSPENPNAILYGPPGTGKTYEITRALNFICQGDRDRYEIITFHPSFSYEDFIEGIKPKGVTKEGNLKFELVNGAFKKFCMKAKKFPDKEFYFVVDEINRANLSSVFGEVLVALEKDYRHDVGNNSKGLYKTQYSSLIEDMMLEEAEKIAYHFEDGNAYFGVPNNVYFIGMMNDVDKSIDAFDLALRRRFKWVRKDCDYDVIFDQTKYRSGEPFTNIEKYINSCKALNKFICEELALGRSYEFGHSFFMKISSIASKKNISEKNATQLFELYLEPTLKEYLRTIHSENELDGKLSEAKEKFIKPLK